jgi:hypothetical protein
MPQATVEKLMKGKECKKKKYKKRNVVLETQNQRKLNKSPFL